MNRIGPVTVRFTVNSSRTTGGRGLRITLRIITAAALAGSGYLHLHLAARYAPIRTSTLSQQDVFVLQAVLAFVVAGLLLLWGRRPAVIAALLLGAGTLAAILTYRYVNVGTLGPLPDMYEPIWYTQKTVTVYLDALTTVGAIALLFARRGLPAARQQSRS